MEHITAGIIVREDLKNSDFMQKSNEQFIGELKKKNASIKPLESYKGSRIHIKVKCLICGHEWLSMPTNLLHGFGCKRCASSKLQKDRAKTLKEFEKDLHVFNPEVKVLSGKYVNAHSRLMFKCKLCNYEWQQTPNGILNNSIGCPKCALKIRANRRRKSQEDFILELSKLRLDIKPLENYINANTPIEFVCNQGHHFYRAPQNIFSRKIDSCPICSYSVGEKKVCDFLDKYNVEYFYQYSFPDCKYHYRLPFDFYIESANMCIEFDGIQHFQPVDFAGKGLKWANNNFRMIQIKDNIKNDYCKEHHINLIRIPYWEEENIGEILIKELTCS